jgi:hypothetical protein
VENSEQIAILNPSHLQTTHPEVSLILKHSLAVCSLRLATLENDRLVSAIVLILVVGYTFEAQK